MRTEKRLWPALVMCIGAWAQPTPIGNWQGSLSAGPLKLRVALHITAGENGELTSTLDSLDQNLFGIAVRQTRFADGRLCLSIPVLHAHFEGDLSPDGTGIRGTFTQGAAMPMILTRVKHIALPVRAQEPRPPFPYRIEEAGYENGSIHLAGTLTLPPGPGPFPAAILISGSGAQNRDGAAMGHKPFLVIADYLTRRGIAVLRVDDRGVGRSTGSKAKATLDEIVGDVLAGMRYLRARPEVDRRRTGVIGHSMGATAAAMAAARSSDIAFVVMLAGPGVSGDQILHAQAEAIGVTPKADAGAERQRAAAVSPWMRSFILSDPSTALRRVRVPVLALNGSRDVQVLAKQNLPPIATALAEGGNQDFVVAALPGLNHLFQRCKLCTVTEYADLDETFSPPALVIIGDWLARH